MKAKAVKDAITLLNALWQEGHLILETGCESYDDFKSLPAAVIYQGMECAKTGWSSDTGRACYKSGTDMVAKPKPAPVPVPAPAPYRPTYRDSTGC